MRRIKGFRHLPLLRHALQVELSLVLNDDGKPAQLPMGALSISTKRDCARFCEPLPPPGKTDLGGNISRSSRPTPTRKVPAFGRRSSAA